MPATTPGNAPLTRPPRIVRVVMRPMTRVFNPLIRRVAGGKHMSMAAQIHHRGRRSGRTYVTPASARLAGETFWIPLTFGAQSDWCQNVLAAGGCMIHWKGRDYPATGPVVVDKPTALGAAGSAFKAHERAFMRVVGINHFLRLDVA